MKARLVLLTLALLTAAGAAVAAEDRPPQTVYAQTVFEVATTFTHLAPSARYDFTWTANFADGDTYVLGGSGRASEPTGTLVVRTDVADLVYYDPGKPLEWVRVCLRPWGSRVDVVLVAADGQPLCANIETGGYRNGYPDAEPGYTELARPTVPQVAQVVQARQAAARRG